MTKPLNEDMTFHESYGMLPKHLLRMVKRFNVSPADWNELTDLHGTDWEGIREVIINSITPGTRNYSSFLAFHAHN